VKVVMSRADKWGLRGDDDDGDDDGDDDDDGRRREILLLSHLTDIPSP